MKVQLVIRTSGGTMIEKGLALKDYGTIVVNVLEQVPELNDVMRDIKYGRLVLGHEDSLIHLDETFTKLLDVEDEDFVPQEIEEDFIVGDLFEDSDARIQFGILNNKDLQ